MPFFKRQNPLLGYWKKACDEPTKAEASIEPHIAKLGVRYRHQYPFWGLKYFADFALLDDQTIIEVDGPSHDTPEQKEKDLLHELGVLELGWTVVRVTNEQALTGPAKAVQAALAEAWAARLHDKEQRAQLLRARLDRLQRNHPKLLAAHAKRATSKTRASKAAAQTRRRRARLGMYSEET